MKTYSVKQLAAMAGVSVRTLHLYDEKGLLHPATRTESGYRRYGEAELLRLQQILFYRELDFTLKEISEILDDPDFDTLQALEDHKLRLLAKKERMAVLLNTIDKTISHLKQIDIMSSHEELYEGFPKDQAQSYREEAMEKWGKKTVEQSEQHLMAMGKKDFTALKEQFTRVNAQLFELRNTAPTAPEVQAFIKRHYHCIEGFWGKKPNAAAYKGLGELYVQDERYSMVDGVPQPDFAQFLSQAMAHFAERL
ncbi:MAG: MerR family transcriptional regulator [Saprospiraceae bacterium]|nr:MerR family transcriptional regulator [Lewinella sp.]